MAYIGNDLQVAFPSYRIIDDISGSFNGVLKTFALNIGGTAPVPFPINPQQCLISVNGVVQKPDPSGATGFNLVGTNIVFASAPTAGWAFFGTVLAGADYVNVGANFPDGSVSAPSITFDADTNTGLYRVGADQIGITCGGVNVSTFTASGQAFPVGSVASPSITFTGDTNTGIYRPAADTIAFSEGGVEAMRIDSSGRVGIGTTSPSVPLEVNGNARVSNFSVPDTNFIGFGSYTAYLSGSSASNFINFSTGSTERARIDSSGRLLVGTSSARANFYNSTISAGVQIEGTTGDAASLAIIADRSGAPPRLILAASGGSTIGSNAVVATNNGAGSISFQASDGTEFVQLAEINADVDGTPGANDMPGRLVFSTTADGASSPTERMRLTSVGRLSVRSDTTAPLNVLAGSAASATDDLVNGYHSSSDISNGTACIRIKTNGNVQNTNGSYTTISDAKLKENIINASSQWNDLKAIQIRNWNFKAETGHETHRQIGPIAQELETVCPGLVFETPDRDVDGNETGEVTKGVNQSVLYMKAVKALQEAMERIEQLESEMAAVKAQLL